MQLTLKGGNRMKVNESFRRSNCVGALFAILAGCGLAEEPVGADEVSPAAEGEIPFITPTSCPSNILLNTPVAAECCYGPIASDPTGTYTSFVRQSDSMVITRKQNPNGGIGCRAADGVSLCSGAACFYGPLGFGRATTSPYNGSHLIS